MDEEKPEETMSRAKILKAIRTHKLSGIALAEIDMEKFEEELSGAESIRIFTERITEAGGKALSIREKDIKSLLFETYGHFEKISDRSGKTDLANFNPDEKEIEALEQLDVLITEGEFGVVENGAVWLPESKYGFRVLPFITKHLVMLLSDENLVETMHGAMERLRGFTEGYGVFVSGPSKTADIEQALVIGAHGALSVTIVLYH